jgi:hypothetical protein
MIVPYHSCYCGSCYCDSPCLILDYRSRGTSLTEVSLEKGTPFTFGDGG